MPSSAPAGVQNVVVRPVCLNIMFSAILCHCCRVRVLCPDCQDQLGSIRSEAQALALIQQHGSSELGFLQFFNLHRSKGLIAELVRSKQLAATAAQLLAAKKLRLYQVCGLLMRQLRAAGAAAQGTLLQPCCLLTPQVKQMPMQRAVLE